jgi:hypothetical protein
VKRLVPVTRTRPGPAASSALLRLAALGLTLALLLPSSAIDSAAETRATPVPESFGATGAALPAHESGSEYWDITAQMDSGHWIFARFQITNDGPGDRIGVALGHVILPDGRSSKFRNGRLRKRWTLAEDRMRLDIGSSHLDLHRPRFRLQVEKHHVMIDLWIESTPFERLPSDLTGSDYSVDLLSLGGTSTGNLWLEGMPGPISLEGRTTLTHTISRRDEPKLTQRRIEVILQNGPVTLYAAEFLSPAGAVTGWLAARLINPDANAGLSDIFSNSSVFTSPLELHLGPTNETQKVSKSDVNTGYWIPHTLEFQSRGPAGKVQVEGSLLRHDPLEDLPAPVRWLVGLRMRPMRVWSRAEIEVTLSPSSGPDSLPLRGRGVVATSYLNALTP